MPRRSRSESRSSTICRRSPSRARRSARRRAGAAARSRAPARSPPAGAHRRRASSARPSRDGDGAVLEQLERPPLALAAPSAAAHHRHLDVLDRVQRRDQVVELEDEADGGGPVLRRVAERLQPLVADDDRPESGLSSAPTRLRSVLLPPPDGPVSRRSRPRPGGRHVLRSPDAAVLERLGDAVDDDLDPPGPALTSAASPVREQIPPLLGHDHRLELECDPDGGVVGQIAESQKFPKKR